MSQAEVVSLTGDHLPSLVAREGELALRMRLAREAQAAWAELPVADRARKLTLVADALIARTDELVALIGDENGKRAVEAIGHEIASSIATVRWLCEEGAKALEPHPIPIPWMAHRKAEQRRAPWGVALVISPWNFPLSIPLGQVVAGLLAGNAVLLKPSEVTPRIGDAIGELLEVCRLPVNLFQVVQGDGAIGAALVDLRPDKVFFTGSLATGRRVMAAAARHPIPVSMELGGVDALIVLDDADVELASSAAAWGGFMNGGQVCASVERVLVADTVAERFVQRLTDKARGLEPARDLGPMTADKQRAIYDRHVADARERGLDVLAGGRWLDGRTYAPTVIDGPGATMDEAAVYREETFGPLIAVRRFRSDAEAIRLHNSLWGGLTASVFSASRARAESVAGQLDAGLVSINDVAATLHAVPELPWGGVGASGFGRSHGVEGLLEFTWSKVVEAPRAPGLDFKRPWWFPYGADQAALMRAFGEVIGERDLRRRARAARTLLGKAAGLITRKNRL